jgi:hypothetical protein
MKIEINNLTALIQGRELNLYQRRLALEEWHKLLNYVDEIEQALSMADVSDRHSWLNKDDLEFAIALQNENRLEAVKWLCEKAKVHSLTPLKDAKEILDAYR